MALNRDTLIYNEKLSLNFFASYFEAMKTLELKAMTMFWSLKEKSI